MSWIAYDIMIASLFWRCHIMPCSSISRPCHVSFQFTHVMYTLWLAQSHSYGITKALSPGSVSFNASISAMSSLPTENWFAKTIGFVLGIMDWQEALGNPWGWTFDVMLMFGSSFCSWWSSWAVEDFIIFIYSFLKQSGLFFGGFWPLQFAYSIHHRQLVAVASRKFTYRNTLDLDVSWLLWFFGPAGSISAWSAAVALFHAMRRFQVQPDDVSCLELLAVDSSEFVFMATHGKWGLNEGMRFL